MAKGTGPFDTMKDVVDPKTGEKIIDTLRLGGACSYCMKRGKGDDCNHQIMTTSWASNEKAQRVGHLAKALGRGDHFDSEMGGGVSESFKTRRISQKDITKMMELDPCRCPVTGDLLVPKIIYMAADPSGGGGSELAVMMWYYCPYTGKAHVSMMMVMTAG